MIDHRTVVAVQSATITTAPAPFAQLSVGDMDELAVDLSITALDGVDTKYTLNIDRLGADGVYYQIYSTGQLNTPQKISLSLGDGVSTNVSFGDFIRVSEVLQGTTPSVTRSISIKGKG